MLCALRHCYDGLNLFCHLVRRCISYTTASPLCPIECFLYTLHCAMMLHYIAYAPYDRISDLVWCRLVFVSPHYACAPVSFDRLYALPLAFNSASSSAAICSSILAPRDGSLPCDLAMLVGCRRASSASSSCFFSMASTRSASARLLAMERSSFESRRWWASGLPTS